MSEATPIAAPVCRERSALICFAVRRRKAVLATRVFSRKGLLCRISENFTYRLDVSEDFVDRYWCVALGMSRMQLGENDKPVNSRGCVSVDAALVEASYRGHRNFQFSQFGWALMLLCFALQSSYPLFRLLHGERKTVPAV